jgi:hypothetical protein
MATFESGLFTNDDFLQISNVLYSPKEEEMIARTLFKMNTSYAPYALEIGYDYYQRTGSAKILAKGGSAKDIPFVGEKGGRVTQKVYDIVTGIRYTQAERDAIAAKRALGKGPAIQLDTLRVSTARRYILETENAMTFKGDATYNVKGIFDSSFYGTDLGTRETVATGTGGYTWAEKTAAEILTDLEKAVSTVEADGIFKARTLVLPPAQYNRLRKPFSTSVPMTLLQWLNSEGMYFENIVTSRVMKAANNGDTVDYFMVIDNDPEVVELAITNDIHLGDPVYDIVGTMEMAAMESYGGILLRHPAAVYIGKGI